MSVTDNQIVFVILERVKTTSPGKAQLRFSIPSFPQDSCWCPCLHVKQYIEKTMHLRPCDRLFISYCKPYKSVGSSTIARLLKKVLNPGYIDTSVISKALFKGATVPDIMKLADWSRPYTFNKYY